METRSDTYFVIRVKTCAKTSTTGEKTYWRYIVTRYNVDTLTDRIEEATSFDESTVENLIRTYQNSLKRYGDADIDYIKVSIKKVFEPIDLSKDEYLEERRRVALAKLSDDDIKALGIEPLAVYNKLKYGEGTASKT